MFGKISSYNDLTTTPLQIGPRVNFPFPRKKHYFFSVKQLLFLPNFITFHLLPCSTFCYQAALCYKDKCRWSCSPARINYTQETNSFSVLRNISVPIRGRSNTDFSCAKCNAFSVRRLPSIIIKYFEDILALTSRDLWMSVRLKSPVITQLSSPEITDGAWGYHHPDFCGTKWPAALGSVQFLGHLPAFVSPSSHGHLFLQCQTISCYGRTSSPLLFSR